MKKRGNRALLLICVILILMIPNNSFAAEYSPNFDVVFVIDGSDSMDQADPNGVSLEATKMFMDMCEYGSTRVGYVLYRNTIKESSPLRSIADEQEREKIKDEIDSFRFSGYTDIALGLTEGKNLLFNESQGKDRNPFIILLSDGNSDLSKGPRTQEESDAEMEMTLAELAEAGIPVYAIGLNYDGSLNAETMELIAFKTGGLSYMTDSVATIPTILSEIFAHNINSDAVRLDSYVGDGASREVEIMIPNNSILEANIIVLSSSRVKDLHIYDYSGKELVMPSDTIAQNSSDTYTQIKIYRPTEGIWKLKLTGAEGDKITINLLSYYGLGIDVSLSNNSPIINEEVYLEASLKAADGTITDDQLLDGVTGTATVYDSAGSELKSISLEASNRHMWGSFSLEEAKDYSLVVRFDGIGGTFEAASEPIEISTLPPPIPLQDDGKARVFMLSKVIFTQKALPLIDVVDFVPETEFSVSVGGNDWVEISDITYNDATKELNFKALSVGSGEAQVMLTDQFGQRQDFTVMIRVLPSWPLLLILAALILFITLKLRSVRKKRELPLSGVLEMRLNLPEGFETPVATSIVLASVGTKTGKRRLYEVIKANPDTFVSQKYIAALQPAQAFFSNIMLEKKAVGDGTLYIHIPRPPKDWSMRIGENEWESAKIDRVTAMNEYSVACVSPNGEMFELVLSYEDGQSSLGNNEYFEGGNASEDPYGGGDPFSNNGFGEGDPFGGGPFGGNDSTDAFGSSNDPFAD